MRSDQFAKTLAAAAVFFLAAGSALADGNSSDSSSPAISEYSQAEALIRQKNFQPALALLEKMVAQHPKNADAHNLLGYCSRKLGRYEEALAHYRRALAIDPGHRGAHEYIGEAYLALNQPKKAREHLAALNKACWLPCEEYTDLKLAIEAYLAKNP